MPTRLLNATLVTRVAISFTIVVASFWAYSWLAVPWIEPVAVERNASAVSSASTQSAPVLRHAKLLKTLYPDASAWQRQRPKVVETDQVMLMLKDYRTLEDGRVEIKPCTLLFINAEATPRADGLPGRVMVLDAPEGAILQFEESLDLRRAEFGRIVGGRLVGEVTIRSNESKPGADDNLLLATRNINMDQRRLWTPHDVEFRFGRSYGHGRDLIMTFLPAPETASGKHGPNIGGLKSLELVQLHRLHLIGGGSMFGDKSSAAADASTPKDTVAAAMSTSAKKQPDVPIEISCAGSFYFDIENSVASFEKQVDVLRLNPEGASDQLQCRLLEIHFSPLLQGDGRSSSKPQDDSIAVQKVVALGYPVVLRSPSMGAQARGERLEYDLAKRQFLLEGEQPVLLEHHGRRIVSRSVRYQLPLQGVIGRAWAQGPGHLKAEIPSTNPDEPPRSLTAQWSGELNLRPDKELHVLSIIGAARVGDDQFGGIAADEIHLWLKETTQQASFAAASEAKDDESSNRLQAIPDRLLAKRNVQLDSPALSGSTDRFEIWFHQVPPDALGKAPRTRDDGSRNSFAVGNRESQRPKSRFHLTGKAVRVLLATAGKTVQLRDVSVEGGAKIVETQTVGPDDIPVKIQGDFIHLSGADSPRAKAVVAGKPAIVSGRGVTLQGDSVHLDRGANRVWVPGAGEAQLPVGGIASAAAMSTAADGLASASGGPAGDSSTNQSARVTWKNGLQFDGQTIQLRGNVVANTAQQRLDAPAVDISLAHRVDFSQPPLRNTVDVHQIRFLGSVAMENRSVEEGTVVSIDQMRVRDLTIDQATGALTADGPGWIKTVRRGSQLGPQQFGGPALGGVQPRGTAPADTARQQPQDDKLTYLRVTFQSALTGNIHQRHVELHEGVRAIYGNVQRWDETIDPDRALDTHQDVVLLTSDTLQVTETQAARSQAAPGMGPVELQALGNALVEGKTFTARAHRIAYAQAKDLMVIEGDGRSDAELYRQSHVGSETGRASARKILYWPGTGRMDVDTFNSLDWGGPPATAGRSDFLPSGVGRYLQSERNARPSPAATPPR